MHPSLRIKTMSKRCHFTPVPHHLEEQYDKFIQGYNDVVKGLKQPESYNKDYMEGYTWRKKGKPMPQHIMRYMFT